MPDDPQYKPRTALITGAGRRIGAAVARALAKAGYAVVLHGNHSRAEAEALAGEIAGQGGRASVVLGDLADAEAVARIVPAAAAFAPLTLLVNNASEFDEDEIASLERARFERTLAVNLTAPLFLAQAFAAQAPREADCANRQYPRPAGAEADAALFLLRAEQGGARQRDLDAGTGAGAGDPRQWRGAGADAAKPAADAGAICRAGKSLAACAGADAGGHRRRCRLSRIGKKRHRRCACRRRRPASRLAHRGQRCRGIARLSLSIRHERQERHRSGKRIARGGRNPLAAGARHGRGAAGHAQRRPRRDRARRQARAAVARRLSHARRQGRRALCRQGEEHQEARRRTTRGRRLTTRASRA